MVQEIYVENIKEILRNKKIIENQLKIKLSNIGKNFFIDGKPEVEYLTLHVLEAVNSGFSVERALLLMEEGMIFQSINIKDITKRKDLERVRARIIGKKGKTLKTLHNLTECDIAMHDNNIGIIGNAEEIKDAIQAITLLIQGSKQGNVYARLEKQRKRKNIENRSLGLEIEKE